MVFHSLALAKSPYKVDDKGVISTAVDHNMDHHFGQDPCASNGDKRAFMSHSYPLYVGPNLYAWRYTPASMAQSGILLCVHPRGNASIPRVESLWLKPIRRHCSQPLSVLGFETYKVHNYVVPFFFPFFVVACYAKSLSCSDIKFASLKFLTLISGWNHNGFLRPKLLYAGQYLSDGFILQSL